MKAIDKYLSQALDNYPYSLTETIESLEYALSYDETNTTALCLTGRLYAEQLMNYEEAKKYFQEALTCNLYALEIYPHFVQTLIWNDDFEEAQKLIDFALTIKGINKTEILLKQIQLLEKQMKVKKALRLVKGLYVTNCYSSYDQDIKNAEARLEDKLKRDKKKKK
ncbi:hypothetical protein [Sphingobacterium spiritivorum]|uniref:hypothetical protein n=1 Tax=Sphingobacterium spiritivorum TaxID=258 RepID=UPI003DA47EDD